MVQDFDIFSLEQYLIKVSHALLCDSDLVERSWMIEQPLAPAATRKVIGRSFAEHEFHPRLFERRQNIVGEYKTS